MKFIQKSLKSLKKKNLRGNWWWMNSEWKNEWKNIFYGKRQKETGLKAKMEEKINVKEVELIEKRK